MQGIAKAFGRKLVQDEKLKEMIEKRCGVPSSVVMRMAELPEGGELIELNGINFPPVRVENVYVFPGIPEFLRKKFSALKERFRDKPYFASRVYINGEECLIADTLDAVAKRFPMVEIGSYPKIGERDYKVLVTFESMEEEAVRQAVEELLKLLPREIVLRTL
jgi:FAD synthetase